MSVVNPLDEAAPFTVEGEGEGFGGLSDLLEMPHGAPESGVEQGLQVNMGEDFAEVVFDATPPKPAATGFKENLAEILPEHELSNIAQRVGEWVDADEEARKGWYERIKEGLKVMGIETLEDGDVAIPGASNLTHPLIAEACVQFQARAMEELFPPEGPVKTMVVGERTDKTEAQAMRVQEYLNYRLTQEDEEYVEDKDKMTFILPAHGSTFSKRYRDPVTMRIVSRTCEGGSVLVPYTATSIDSAPRVTHRFNMDRNDVKRAMANGMYRTVELTAGQPPSDDDPMREVSDKADDLQPVVSIDDDDRTLWECHCNLDVSADAVRGVGFQLPYIVTVDKDSLEVLALRRNWRESDTQYRKRQWFTQHKYLPGFGIYGLGLLHLIGVLAKAAGGALRALLDGAAAANFQGGFKTKENKLSGSVRLKFGEWQESNMSADEMRNGFYTPPFKEPSPALFNLLDHLVSSGQRFASITEAMVGDVKQNMPVGTIISIIEQGSKVFSGIHKRLHNSHRREYRSFAELIAEEEIPLIYPYPTETGPREIMAQDFDDRVDIFPVSDPSIYSAAQRVAQNQAVLELIKSEPSLYDEDARRETHRRMLRSMKAPDIDKILPEKKVKRLDPVSENQGFMTGKPARAFAEQDHQAHLAVHMTFMAGLGEEDAKAVMPVMAAHIAEHKAYLYRQQIEMAMGQQLPMPVDLGASEEMDPEMERAVARAVAQSGAAAGPGGQSMGGEGGGDQQAAQMAEQAKAMQDMHQKIMDGQLKLEKMGLALERAKDAVTREKMVVMQEKQNIERERDDAVRDINHAKAEMRADAEQQRLRLEGLVGKLDLLLERIKTTGDMVLQQLESMEEPKEEAEKAKREKAMGDVTKVLADAMAVMSAPRTTQIKRGPDGRAEQLTTTTTDAAAPVTQTGE